MKQAINIINFGDCGDARVLADPAERAAASSWIDAMRWRIQQGPARV